MKFKWHHIFNITFSNFIISQMNGKKQDNELSEEAFRHKLILNAIKSSYSFYTIMKSLVLYVGPHQEYCVVFQTDKINPNDTFEPTTAIFWSKDNEISMVNLSWIDIWHLKTEYKILMENYIERVDYSDQIHTFLKQSKDFIDKKV